MPDDVTKLLAGLTKNDLAEAMKIGNYSYVAYWSHTECFVASYYAGLAPLTKSGNSALEAVQFLADYLNGFENL